MVQQQQQNEKSIFLAAVDIDSDPGRAAFVEQACAGNHELRAGVEALLRAHLTPQPVLDERLIPPPVEYERPGSLVGTYTLVELIGQGGMGTVWMAQQFEPVKRLVAIKLIRAGMDSRQVIARFEAERQALALMDHPNIAKVLDAGTLGVPSPGGAAADGSPAEDRFKLMHPHYVRPYFVMEFVHGQPITQYCDERQLTLRQRLELLLPVCQAIQHAHQKGIIHRDIKPTNILVAEHDGRAVPKVIDFGVAKATGEPLTDRTMLTGLGAVIGTPEYMSPEQAEVNQIDIDTRSDIYSLGVLLYELLTGTTPLPKKRVKEALLEVLRLVREEDPPLPSTRLAVAAELPSIAANRGLEPRLLSGLVKGELDWIVMKCLEKDRNRRYATANGLARDIERFLHDEAVEASPPGASYRLRKFVKRNKGRVAAAGLVLASLLAGIAGTTWGMVRANQARHDAVAAQSAAAKRAEGERGAKEEAQRRLAQVEKATEILASVFRDMDPTIAEREGLNSRDLLVRRLVDAAHLLEDEAVGDPLVMARLQHVLGSSLFELGHPQEAAGLLVQARRTRERILGPDHLDTADTKHQLAMLYRDQDEFALAESLYNDVLEVRTAKLGAQHLDTAATKHHLAMLYFSKRKYDLAEATLKEALTIRASQLGADSPEALTTRHRLATLYRSQEKYAESEKLHKEVLAVRTAKLGGGHLDTIATKCSLAALYQVQGKFSLAEPLYKDALAVRIAKLGVEHPDTLACRHNLGTLYLWQGQFGSAEKTLQEVVAIRASRHGADHPLTLQTTLELARLYHWHSKFAEAERLYKEMHSKWIARLGAEHPTTLDSLSNLGGLYFSQGKHNQAESIHQEVLKTAKARLGLQHPVVLNAQCGLADLYRLQGKHNDAEALYKDVVKYRTASLGADHSHTLGSLESLGQVHLLRGRHELAEAIFKEVLEKRASTLGADHPDTVLSRDQLAMFYWAAQKPELSIPLLEKTLQYCKTNLGPEHPETLGRQVTLGVHFCEAGRYADGISLIEEVRQKGLADPHPAWVRSSLLDAYVRAGKSAEAASLVAERVMDARGELAADSPGLAAALLENGKLLLDAKAFADAEPLLLEGHQKLLQAELPNSLDERNRQLQIAREQLVQLYDAWGNEEKAKEWRSERTPSQASLK